MSKEKPDFHPGSVVRYGNDPSLLVRNDDGTWADVYLGNGVMKPTARSDSFRTDKEVLANVGRGFAQVVYSSQPARGAVSS